MPHPYPSEPLKFITVRGSDREMGRQHAEAVGIGATEGMPKFFLGLWRRLLGLEPKTPLARVTYRIAQKAIDPWLVGKLLSRVPESAKERMRGVSDVTGQPVEELLTALVLPDIFPLLQSVARRLQPRSFVFAGAPKFGCTSFLARGKNFLQGRNLDFPGVGFWDRYPVAQLTAPKGKLKYVAFTSAGMPIGGITGINEAQLSVALHQHYCSEFSLAGTLPFLIAEKILTECKTSEEALEVLERAKVSTSWAFVVADGKTRRGFILESHSKNKGLRPLSEDEPRLAHSNYFQTPECRPSEYATSARMNYDNYWRKRRLEEIITAAGHALTPEQAVRAVSDHFDRYWNEEKIVNRTISQAYNIQSMVTDPEKMKVWFATGDAPIQLNQYREIDLGKFFAGKNPDTGASLPGFQFQSEAKAQAKQSYILSFIAGFDGEFEKAAELLEESLDHDFCAEASLTAGIVALKLGRLREGTAKIEKAKCFIESQMKEKGLRRPPPEYFEASLFLARALDLAGDRDGALKAYREIASHPFLEDSHLRSLAAKERRYRAEALDRIFMPYSTYVPFV